MSDYTCLGDYLAPASFRGVSFWVNNDKEGYGRRIVTHEYPMRDDPSNEDLGEKAQKFSVVGYVVGDNATAKKEAVVAACRARGAALLQLPAKAAFMAVCETLTVVRRKDEQTYFELTMEFTADPAGSIVSPIGMFESMIGSLMLNVVGSLVAAFSDTFVSVNVLPYVAENAAYRLVDISQALLATVNTIDGLTQTDLTASTATSILALAQNADKLVRPGPGDPEASTCISTIGDVFYNMLASYQPNDLLAPLASLATYTYLESTDAYGNAAYDVTCSSISDCADASNAAAVNGAVRTFALIALASAVSASTFDDRGSAVQARADLVELIGQQLERTTDEDVANALTQARNYAVKSLSQNMANLTPIITVTAPMSLPALYWAGRLYDDATQALSLAERNDVPTPAYMPREFSAIASTD